MSSTPTIAVVGASAAGIAVVESLHRSGYDGSLTLIGDESRLPYERPPLSKRVLIGDQSPESTTIRDAGRLEQRPGLDLRLGIRATALDVADRRLTLETGEELDCAAVVIATGVRPRRIPGAAGTSGVHVLRTVDDATALRKDLLAGGDVVVVGGGVLGTEVAAAARTLGLRVTLATMDEQPLAPVLGASVGRMIADEHRRRGIHVRLRRTVAGLLTAYGRVTGVQLDGGEVIPADVVVVAVGSVPATGWLAGSGLDLADGVGCDSFCVAAPYVYAAGDVARWWHPRYERALRIEHRMNASEQGMVVARNILAKLIGSGTPPEAYEPVPYFWSDQYGWRIQAYGVTSGSRRMEVVRAEPSAAADEPPRVVALYGDEKRVLGAVGIDLRPPALRSLRAAVAGLVPWDEGLDAARAASDGNW
ncbi:NAD(P)/FAD-dependent oxidoreductase [Streptomyces sp. AP-93]|uniref:NAD(P)/FAD-dependent oxidoreductase n=1 Tax=Streptomyces sp. AP-93 TaxID=2929048 RepID=UPI001FAEFE88|nr:FAD-dependent oxidoreductase [Streptomyces sp. AP-93]MCJ0873079.1 FAD-dependent oxidoreductase [Streptomyces sp. AP-93]